jgi:outer membrane protein OmpA-like peptidoglycan-associated protein
MSQLLEYELENELESELEGEWEEEFEGEWEEEWEGEWEEESEGEWESEWEEEWEGEWEEESEFENAPLPAQQRRPGHQPPALRTPRRGVRPRPPVRLPPITIRVRPFVVLRGFRVNLTTFSPATQRLNQRLIQRAASRIVASWRSPGGRRIRSVRLVGHTDSSGSRPYNQALGLRRARAVRAQLIRAVDRLQPGLSRRIGLRNFIPQTLGETRPEAPNTTPAGRARNRRVQIFLSDV